MVLFPIGRELKVLTFDELAILRVTAFVSVVILLFSCSLELFTSLLVDFADSSSRAANQLYKFGQ